MLKNLPAWGGKMWGYALKTFEFCTENNTEENQFVQIKNGSAGL
ncbi:hypothetical protein [Haemophilus paracuniculus]|nr:hypothetical protein [Haemophilus paracuniculus]